MNKYWITQRFKQKTSLFQLHKMAIKLKYFQKKKKKKGNNIFKLPVKVTQEIKLYGKYSLQEQLKLMKISISSGVKNSSLCILCNIRITQKQLKSFEWKWRN